MIVVQKTFFYLFRVQHFLHSKWQKRNIWFQLNYLNYSSTFPAPSMSFIYILKYIHVCAHRSEIQNTINPKLISVNSMTFQGEHHFPGFPGLEDVTIKFRLSQTFRDQVTILCWWQATGSVTYSSHITEYNCLNGLAPRNHSRLSVHLTYVSAHFHLHSACINKLLVPRSLTSTMVLGLSASLDQCLGPQDTLDQTSVGCSYVLSPPTP